MPFRISEDDKRAADILMIRSVGGVCVDYAAERAHKKPARNRRIDNFVPLAEARATYEEMQAEPDEQGVSEELDQAYAAATFTGIHEAVARKCGGVPVGCFQCVQPRPRYIAGAIWIKHAGDKHYLVFMDASGHSTEYRIWFCPYCGKRF